MTSLRLRLRGWLRRRLPQSAVAEAPEPEPSPDWSAPDGSARRGDDPINALLTRMEDAALAVYEAHGLPVREGHYARSPRNPRWTFVAETLSPEDRWALALAQPADAGWRFALVDQLGIDSTVPQVAGAARLLVGVRHLRASLRGHDAPTLRADMEMAIRLGADWRALQPSLDGDIQTDGPSARLKPKTAARSGSKSRK